jgi:hypothetical protein
MQCVPIISIHTQWFVNWTFGNVIKIVLDLESLFS